MDIRIWMAIDAIAFTIAIGLLGVVGPHTLWAFVPEPAALPAMWLDVLVFALASGLAFEIGRYVHEHGID